MAAVREFLENLSPGAKGLAATMVATYVLQLMFPGITSMFALVAGKTIVMPWNVITSGLLQDSFIGVGVFVAAVLFLSRPVEAVQGQAGLLKFLLITQAGAGSLTFFLITTLYYILAVTMAGTAAGDRAGDVLYDPICGFQACLAALLVGIKQALPDNEITVFSSIQFKANYLPSLYILAAIVLGILTSTTLKLVPFALFGTYVAWFYLRFFAYRADSFLRGDPSQDFRFASFFPMVIQPAADEVARVCSTVTRINQWVEAEAQQAQQNSAALLGRASPSKDTFEATRRRERGARALEERLSMKIVTVDRPTTGSQEETIALVAAEEGDSKESTITTEI